MNLENQPFPRHRADALLFDMDGTIVDSTAVVEGLWSDFAARYSVDFTELIDYSHGRQTIDTLRRFLPGTPAELAALASALEIQETERTEGIVEIPGARAFIEQLDATPFAVVTSAGRELATTRLRAAGLPIPAVLVTAEDVLAGKPSPEGYLRAAAELGIDIARCLAFEDAPAGIQAAVNSGASTIVVGAHDSLLTRRLSRIIDYTDLRLVDGVLTATGAL